MKIKLPMILMAAISLVAFSNCSDGGFQPSPYRPIPGNQSQGGNGGGAVPQPTPGTSISGDNVVPVTVGCGYPNEPCVSVTICEPGSTRCQTISNVLVDTGSYGLRLYSSVVTLNLPKSVDSTNQTLAECTSYADGTSQWGPVAKADIVLGSEKAPGVPMQLIDANFVKPPTDCTNLDSNTPQVAGFNGVLGVGLFTQDCGTTCATNSNNRVYFACTGTTCSATTVAKSKQVSNPVPFMPVDNNGVILQMDPVPDSGAPTAYGNLILGIGTQSNNQPGSVTKFPADSDGNFKTIYNGKTYSFSFIDSGSNGIFFPAPAAQLPPCDANSDFAHFYCPKTLVTVTATQSGASGTPQANVTFKVTDASVALSKSNPNMAFSDLGGELSTSFDWGLPFFYGRKIIVGLDGATSSLGAGPYWAY